MRKCPNPGYENIECPYALDIDSPLPCFGDFEQCSKWRKSIKKLMSKKEEENDES